MKKLFDSDAPCAGLSESADIVNLQKNCAEPTGDVASQFDAAAASCATAKQEIESVCTALGAMRANLDNARAGVQEFRRVWALNKIDFPSVFPTDEAAFTVSLAQVETAISDAEKEAEQQKTEAKTALTAKLATAYEAGSGRTGMMSGFV